MRLEKLIGKKVIRTKSHNEKDCSFLNEPVLIVRDKDGKIKYKYIKGVNKLVFGNELHEIEDYYFDNNWIEYKDSIPVYIQDEISMINNHTRSIDKVFNPLGSTSPLYYPCDLIGDSFPVGSRKVRPEKLSLIELLYNLTTLAISGKSIRPIDFNNSNELVSIIRFESNKKMYMDLLEQLNPKNYKCPKKHIIPEITC